MTLIEQAENFIRDRRITDPRDILDNLAQLLADFHREQSEWVAITERLPEDRGEYLVTVWNIEEPDYYETMTADFDGTSEWNHGNLRLESDVIAWRELPAPFTPTETGAVTLAEIENPSLVMAQARHNTGVLQRMGILDENAALKEQPREVEG